MMLNFLKDKETIAIRFDRFRRKQVMLLVCILSLFISGCMGSLNQKRIPVTYTDQIQNLPGGADNIWPEKSLKKAFSEYWNLRYSDAWRNAYEKEVPYFQEIIGRVKYENIVKSTLLNRIDKIVIRSIQKVTTHFYEIQITLLVVNPNNENKELQFIDRWVYVGDSWYHVMRDMLIFPKVS